MLDFAELGVALNLYADIIEPGLCPALADGKIDQRIVSLSIGLTLIVALFGQFGWVHYYLAPLMVVPMLLGPNRARSAILLLIAMLIVCSMWFMYRAPWQLTQSLPFTCYFSLLLLLALRRPTFVHGQGNTPGT